MKGKRVNPPYRPYSQDIKFLLNMVPLHSMDNVAMHILWMFSWRMKIHVKQLGHFHASQIHVTGLPINFLDPQAILRRENDLKMT